MNGLIEGMRRHSREQAEHAGQRAKDWAARQTAAARGPAPVIVPPGANAAQRGSFLGAVGEILIRERQSKVQRGWIRVAQRTAPAGCVPVCALFGAKTIILVVDRAGRLRESGGGKAGSVITISEAARIASGRIAD